MPSKWGPAIVVPAWILLGGAYVWLAHAQQSNLNTCATAGGQYPYLIAAREIARDGIGAVYGDRNRMPLVPALVALAHDANWDRFVRRSSDGAIAMSLVLLIALGGLYGRLLSAWSATAMMVATTLIVFLPKASFVQAELPFYALFLTAFLLLIRLLRRPHPAWAAVAGLTLALAYLSKASALPMLAAYGAVAVVQTMVGARAGRGRRAARASDPTSPPKPARSLACAGIVTAVFLACVSWYITDNHARFGHAFYNVNGTFFMWCDGWAQASAFAQDHDISHRYPDAPPDRIPSAGRYWRTHSTGQIIQRLAYGLGTLAMLSWRHAYGVCVLGAAAILLWLARRHRARLRALAAGHWPEAAFFTVVLAGYLLAYAWYVPVAYGDRFILSLLLPLLFVALWLVDRHAESAATDDAAARRARRTRNRIGMAMAAAATACGAARIPTSVYRPTPTFVRFTFNESRECLRRREYRAARAGFGSVIRWEPDFAPAYRELGAVELLSGRPGDAVQALQRAVELDPTSADAHNSLGSALARVGSIEAAIASFTRATELDPAAPSAWYNLAASLHRAGRTSEAVRAARRLAQLDPVLGARLLEQLGAP